MQYLTCCIPVAADVALWVMAVLHPTHKQVRSGKEGTSQGQRQGKQGLVFMAQTKF